jgi:hypothetical protein
MGGMLDHQERMDYLEKVPENHRNLVSNLMPIFLSVTIANINTREGRNKALASIPENQTFANNSSTIKSFVRARVIHLFKTTNLGNARRF